jgi:hypothetical protein
VKVVLSAPAQDELADRPEQILSEASTGFEPNAKVLAAFNRLTEDRLPDGHLARKDWPKELDYVDAEGNISPCHAVPAWLMPEGFRDFGEQLGAELHAASEAALGVLRWRGRSLGSPRPFSTRGMRWSTDGEKWRLMPATTSVEIISGDRLEITEETAGELQELLDAGRGEPLGHVIFREAWSQRSSNRRGSLLLVIAALEIGVKEYIAACVPDAEWLAMNAPTPPIIEILTEYLPSLEPPGSTGPVGNFDAETVKAIRTAINVRNELAHRGAEVGAERLMRTLRAVRNVLWNLDGALGQPWAEAHKFPSLQENVSQGYRRV